MAEIVSIIGITHNPFMPRLFKQPQQPPGTAKIKERIAMMRQKLAEAKPDDLILVYTSRRPEWLPSQLTHGSATSTE